MSNEQSRAASPSNPSKPTSTRPTPDASKVTSSSTSISGFEETPQAPADTTSSTVQPTPLIIVTGSEGRQNVTSEPSQHEYPPDSSDPYTTPQPHVNPSSTTATMSSASSSPGNTSTAGSSSGSNVQLPYAPFPYPIPANAKGSGQQGSGKGK